MTPEQFKTILSKQPVLAERPTMLQGEVKSVETIAKADLAKLGGLLKVVATKEGTFVVQQYKMHPAAVLAVAGWTVAVGELLLLLFR